MDRILYKEANGDLTCRARDFDKVFPTLYAYEETGMTPEDIEGLKNSYQQLQEINNNTFQSNNAMGSDLKATMEELENVKQERDALLATLEHYAPCEECGHWDMEHEMCRCPTSCLCGEQWIWRGAKDTNVPSKEE